MNRWILYTMLAASFTLTAVGAAAPGEGRDPDAPPGIDRPPGPRAPMEQREQNHPGMLVDRLLSDPEAGRRLDLSEKQIESLKSLRLETARKVIPLRAEVELAEIELHAAMTSEAPDEDAVMAAIDRIHAVRAELQKAEVSTQLTARRIIGPEKLQGVREQVRERMQQQRLTTDRDPRQQRPHAPQRR